ncbi:MAG: SUMF1/EgtB/PvdO family nonheme iron enzyme [Flavobacteriales bacterium]|nr:SUMF1/EgtB/PvdO family nonheme iron enzyme [Flavobacteriales bacterium]
MRKDIAIMNIYMLTDKSYRDLYFAELGIPKMDKTEADYKGNYDAYYVDICKHLLENSDRPIYFAAGICRPIYTSFNENFYNVGLAFKWTDKKFDNIAVTRKNYEKRFLTDYMKIDLFNDISASVNNNMNASYLMPMLTLHNHYKESDEKQNLQDIEYLINQIAEKSGRTEEVQKIISPAKKDNVISKVISDPRDAYWGMVKVNDTLHASQKEVENTMYNKFLLDLLKQKRYKDLDMAKLETVNWDEFLDDRYQSLTQEQIFVHGKPEEDKFPVMNVSYEAALLYCDWLTNIYNNLEHKKKKYTKVKFRLPTEKEWEYLAKSGRSNIENYPWGDRKIKENPNKDYDKHITNSRGCFLANIDASTYSGYFILDKATCPGADTVKYSNKDGGVFPVVVGSYSPNYFGLYNIIGNVSEMVQEKGIAKGGNWNTSVTEAVINKRQLYSGPSPEVGFRVVMIIIEK